MSELNFLPQEKSVQKLLDACVGVLDMVPNYKRQELVSALQPFQSVSAVATWPADAIDPEKEFGLTQDQKREVMSEYIRTGSPTDQEIAAMRFLARDVAHRDIPY